MTTRRIATLSDICTFENGDRGKNYPGKSANLKEGIPFVSAGDLVNGGLRRDTLSYISPDQFSRLNSGKFRRGDLLFCLRGTLGKFALIDSDIRGAIASSLIIIRPSSEIDVRYLKWFLGSSMCEKQIDLYRNGAAQPNLSANSLKKFEIPLPSLDEQRRLVAILDKADALRRKRKRAAELLRVLNQSIFVEMLRRHSRIPLVPLSELCRKITDGTHQSPEWAPQGIPFIFVSNVRNQRITFETKNYVAEEEYERLTKHTPIEPGDVLYTAVGSYGNAAVVPEAKKFIFQRHIAHLKPNPNVVESRYLSMALESPDARRQADQKARGVAQKTVTLSGLKEIVIPVPSLALQKGFVSKVDAVDRQLDSMENSIFTCDALLSSLQHRAFSGQL